MTVGMNLRFFRKPLFRIALGVCLFFMCAESAFAQRIGLKTNALYLAAMSPNIGAEFRINRHVTLNFEAMGSLLKVGKIDTKMLAFSPEARYWFSARPQAGHFMGLMAIASNYDLLLDDTRHKGDSWGGGLTYGYSFVLGRRWSLETTIGVGAVRVNEKKFIDETEEEPEHANNTKWTLAPLKAGVTFVYLLK